jgi:hypothetical protein
MDIGCICCGADVTALYPHPLPTMGAMCAACRREVRKMRSLRRPLRPAQRTNSRPALTSTRSIGPRW